MLTVDNLHVAYGPLNVLRGVSFAVKPGTIVAMIGANGAGKTTTLNTISGLLSPTSGTIEFEGRRIAGLPPEQIIRAGIAQVPEGRKIFRNLTVHECLRMGGYARSDQKAVGAEIDRMYEIFPRLKERRKQLAGTMSGGEQQMLAFARALVAAPRLLLLDEPSMGLAPKIVADLSTLIRDIRRDGITILLVEQNASLALGVADEGIVLEGGRITAASAARELLANERVRSAYLGA
jgi:branched-chain amino acid transport system ATP-binding protein